MQLSDAQIDFILADITHRGVSLPGLDESLLDHICCCIENDPDVNSDFETLYQKHITHFYKRDLWEIEEETLTLLTFKNYYTMKKIMILSGLFSVFTMIIGMWFKLMHYPGAAVIFPFGIMCGSFVFMPLLLTLKAREKQTLKDKTVLATGGLSVLLIGLCFIVKLIGGPANSILAMTLFYFSAAISLLVFLPFYLSVGLRNPATKINSIVTAVIVTMSYTLLFSMTYNKRSEPIYRTMQTHDYLRSQQILTTERLLAAQRNIRADSNQANIAQSIDETCEQAKAMILKEEIGFQEINADFESKKIMLTEHAIYFDQPLNSKLNELKKLIPEYNETVPTIADKITLSSTFLYSEENNRSYMSVMSLLNQLTQLQMSVLQHERTVLADN